MKIEIKPWTDHRGFVLSTEEMRRVSKGWSNQQWPEYLKTLEIKRSGLTFAPDIYDGMCGDLTEIIFDLSSGTSPENLSELIKLAIGELSEKQAKVIDLIFWQGMSQHDIARELKIQQSSVFNLKGRALQNLKKYLQKLQGAVNPRLMRGEEDFEHLSTQTLSDQIREVMRAEINRNDNHESYWRIKNGKK